MQRSIWAVKRAHWRSWAALTGMLKQWKASLVTPARYDVLHTLMRKGAMAQKELVRLLGVAKSTLSELLAKMERLGLVSRSRRRRSGRVVSLTTAGVNAHQRGWMVESWIDRDVAHAFRMSDRRQLTLEKACLMLRSAFDEDVRPKLLYEFFVIE